MGTLDYDYEVGKGVLMMTNKVLLKKFRADQARANIARIKHDRAFADLLIAVCLKYRNNNE